MLSTGKIYILWHIQQCLDDEIMRFFFKPKHWICFLNIKCRFKPIERRSMAKLTQNAATEKTIYIDVDAWPLSFCVADVWLMHNKHGCLWMNIYDSPRKRKKKWRYLLVEVNEEKKNCVSEAPRTGLASQSLGWCVLRI